FPSDRTVRAVVRAIRRELRDPLERAHLPLSYEPGVDAQVDFMERQVDDATEGRVKRHVLIVRACFSRRVFRYAAPNQTREASTSSEASSGTSGSTTSRRR